MFADGCIYLHTDQRAKRQRAAHQPRQTENLFTKNKNKIKKLGNCGFILSALNKIIV
jgi:hypothetical protein